MSVSLFPINVETAELSWSKFFLVPHVTPGKVYKWSIFQKFASNQIRYSIFNTFWKYTEMLWIFMKSTNSFVCFCFAMQYAICNMYTKRKYSQLKWKMGAKRPKSPVYYCWVKREGGGFQGFQVLKLSGFQVLKLSGFQVFHKIFNNP